MVGREPVRGEANQRGGNNYVTLDAHSPVTAQVTELKAEVAFVLADL